MARTERLRPRIYADPATVLAVSAGIACGGLGATYPTGLLGEQSAPGLWAGVLLGVVAALASAPLWMLPIAIDRSAGTTARSMRTLWHAHGQGPVTSRVGDLRACTLRLALGAFSGGTGGLFCALLQAGSVGRPAGPASLAPSPHALVTALGVAAFSILLGFAIGTASTDTGSALVVMVAALAVSAVLIGTTYFAPGVGPFASATPLGVLLVVSKDQLLAPQFTQELTTPYALIGAALWTSILVMLSLRRIRDQVS